jgi:hypothetical protein
MINNNTDGESEEEEKNINMKTLSGALAKGVQIIIDVLHT